MTVISTFCHKNKLKGFICNNFENCLAILCISETWMMYLHKFRRKSRAQLVNNIVPNRRLSHVTIIASLIYERRLTIPNRIH